MRQAGTNSIADGGADSEKRGIPNIFLGALGGINDVQGLHCCQKWQALETRAVSWKLGGLKVLARVETARFSQASIRRARGRLVLLRFLVVLGAARAAGAAASAAASPFLGFVALALFGLLALALFLVLRKQWSEMMLNVGAPGMAAGITTCWFQGARDGT